MRKYSSHVFMVIIAAVLTVPILAAPSRSREPQPSKGGSVERVIDRISEKLPRVVKFFRFRVTDTGDAAVPPKP